MKRSCLALMLVFGLVASASAEESKLQYNRDIRPLLAENCFACHGPDSASRKADLRLDKRDAAVDLGAILPGKPSESEIIARIESTDPDKVMPPPKTKKSLKPAEKETLKRWIAQGAEYQQHWSFIAPVRPTPPAVKNNAWVRNPIDQFVLAKLEASGLQPAPEADRRTLARRLSLDLIGLPPTPEAVDAFVADSSTDAYEKLVDRLMQSKQWGEHRARYWLDAARYGDTHGIHIDNFREIWAYRDWVIDAFNRNERFDRFTLEQLAGDLLPNPTLEQRIATGFNRCNITTSEGGAISEEYAVLYTRDRTETTSQVWMGLSMNCTVCHDHKFDPLKQREFYEMAAFFNNTTQKAMDGNIKDTPPVMPVVRLEDRERFAELESKLDAAKTALEERRKQARPDFHKWLASDAAKPQAVKEPEEKLAFHAPLNEGDGNILHFACNGQPQEYTVKSKIDWRDAPMGKAFKSEPGAIELPEVGDFERDQPFSVSLWVRVEHLNQSAAFLARMDDKNDYRGWDVWIQNGRIGSHLIHAWPKDAVKVVSKTPIKANEWTHVVISHNGTTAPEGVKIYFNGEMQKVEVEAKGLKETTRTKVPLKIATRHSSSPLHDTAMHDLRIYDRELNQNDVRTLAKSVHIASLLVKAADKRTDADKNELYQWWLGAEDSSYMEAAAKMAAVEHDHNVIANRGTVAHVMQETKEMPKAYILFRGEYDQRRDEVQPGTPASLPPFPNDLPRNRLGLAQWLLRPEHPLTARVTVNRFWQELFGTGIVKSTGDFGVSGELPSHQELLDWLAIEFRDSGWDVQHLYKLLVTSAAYRQLAVASPEKLEKDPQNRLISRGPRFRMDAEMVRDYALAASSLLSPKIGGPSVRPYQPSGVWEAVAMTGSNTRDYKQDSGDGLYRRSMYTFWKRAAPPASMDIFNAPSREVCVTRRERTNTPLQALVTLNDPQFVEAARHLAETALQQSENDSGRIDYIARRLLARSLRAEEVPIVTASLEKLRAFYIEHADAARQLIAVGESKADAALDAGQLASYSMLTNELLNLDEVLNK